MSNQQKLKIIDCKLGCGTKIFWNVTENMYVEYSTRKKHICPNKDKLKSGTDKTWNYEKKPSFVPYQKKESVIKPEMYNSVEFIQGSPKMVREEYEILSDLVKKAGGKVHGSQSNFSGGVLYIVVYYEVPELSRSGVKEAFEKMTGGD